VKYAWIAAHRHELEVERWVEVLGSERLTFAALDRLTHRCPILECNGESYRLKDAQRRRRGTITTSSDKD
jgi:DNA replication protein DnaC